jgi:hypothetical protein
MRNGLGTRASGITNLMRVKSDAQPRLAFKILSLLWKRPQRILELRILLNSVPGQTVLQNNSGLSRVIAVNYG